MIYMLTIYCKKCGKDVKVTRNCICPHCKKDWTDEVSKEIDIDEVFDDLMDEESEELISNYLFAASRIKVTALLSGVIAFILITLYWIIEERPYFEYITISLAIGLGMGYGSWLELHFKWKANMLHYTKKKK